MNNDIILSVENLSKQYQLGVFGSGTIGGDVQRWWYKMRGKEDPFLKIGETNDRATKSNSEFVWALKDINFEVRQGEVLGIIGKNGAGKSTLLKILSRVTGPTTGSIRSRGRMASLLEVGTGFHPELTGLENIYLNGTILGMTKAEIKRKLEEIIDFSGIARYIDTPVKRYSTGMTVRLGFAIAAFLEPEILVVDEVLAVGDAEFQKKAIGKMKEVSEGGGRTVLFVSHNMQSIENLCTKCLVLKDGMISFSGSVKTAINFYLNSQIVLSKNEINKRTDRMGSKEIMFTGIKIFDIESNEELSNITSGKHLSFRISYLKKTEEVLKNVSFSLAFFNNEERMMFTCNSYSKAQVFTVVKDKNYVECRFDKFPLSPGEYYVNLLAYTRGKELLDKVERAKIINVEQGDYFGTGHLPAPQRQQVYIDFNYFSDEV